MKKTLRLTSIFFVLVMLFTSFSFANNNSLLLDGNNKNFKSESFNGRTYIQSSSLENLGIGLNTSIKNNIVTIKNKKVTLKFTLNTNNVEVNEVPMTLDVKTYMKDNEAYLPLRFILETLGYEIKWNDNTKSIDVNKNQEIKYPIEINNQGSIYTVNKAPEAIVSLAPSVTEILFAIGAEDMVKGRTQYCTYPTEAKSITVVGNMTDPSAETIVSMEPDLVIAGTHYKPEVLSQFKKAGINVVAKDSPDTLDEMYNYTLKLGAIVGKNYEARALVSAMKSKVETVEMFTKRIKNKPDVYYVVGTGQGGEYTAGKDTFIAEVIGIAGGNNIANDITGWSYTLEKLIDNNPDIIFGSADGYNTMDSNPNYSSLQAIQNKKYITVNKDIFSRPSPRLINQGLKILVKGLHGNLAKLLNF